MSSRRRELPAAARIYRRSLPVFAKSLRLQRAVFNGVWIGLLGRESLQAVDERYYNEHQLYHGDAHNLSGLNSWEDDVLERYFHQCRSILVGSAGGGREVIALQRRGFDADGFECHVGLVENANRLLASEEGLRPTVVHAARDECPQLDRRYDGVIVGWGGYMLIQTRSRRIEFLRALGRQLVPGAPLLVSFFYRDSVTAYLRVVAALGSSLRRLQRLDRIQVGDNLEPNFVHYFSRAEIASELEAAGFEMALFSTEGYAHAVGIRLPQLD
jgi:hypothetical protein